MKPRFVLCLVLLLCAVTQSADYFPLAKGNWWKFDMLYKAGSTVGDSGDFYLEITNEFAHGGIRVYSLRVRTVENDGELQDEFDESDGIVFYQRENAVFLGMYNREDTTLAGYPICPRTMTFGDTTWVTGLSSFPDEDSQTVVNQFARKYGDLTVSAGAFGSCYAFPGPMSKGVFILAPGVGLVGIYTGLDEMELPSLDTCLFTALKDYRVSSQPAPSPPPPGSGLARSATPPSIKLDNGLLSVISSREAPARLLVFGPDGRLKAQTSATPAQTIDVNRLLQSQAGTVFMRIFVGGEVFTRKFTVTQ